MSSYVTVKVDGPESDMKVETQVILSYKNGTMTSNGNGKSGTISRTEFDKKIEITNCKFTCKIGEISTTFTFVQDSSNADIIIRSVCPN